MSFISPAQKEPAFFGTLQVERLDEHRSIDRQHLALAIFDLDRSLVKPLAPALLLRHAQPRRLRDHQRGMITTPSPSIGTGSSSRAGAALDAPPEEVEPFVDVGDSA